MDTNETYEEIEDTEDRGNKKTSSKKKTQKNIVAMDTADIPQPKRRKKKRDEANSSNLSARSLRNSTGNMLDETPNASKFVSDEVRTKLSASDDSAICVVYGRKSKEQPDVKEGQRKKKRSSKHVVDGLMIAENSPKHHEENNDNKEADGIITKSQSLDDLPRALRKDRNREAEPRHGPKKKARNKSDGSVPAESHLDEQESIPVKRKKVRKKMSMVDERPERYLSVEAHVNPEVCDDVPPVISPQNEVDLGKSPLKEMTDVGKTEKPKKVKKAGKLSQCVGDLTGQEQVQPNNNLNESTGSLGKSEKKQKKPKKKISNVENNEEVAPDSSADVKTSENVKAPVPRKKAKKVPKLSQTLPDRRHVRVTDDNVQPFMTSASNPDLSKIDEMADAEKDDKSTNSLLTSAINDLSQSVENLAKSLEKRKPTKKPKKHKSLVDLTGCTGDKDDRKMKESAANHKIF